MKRKFATRVRIAKFKALKKHATSLVLLGLVILVTVIIARYSSIPDGRFVTPLRKAADITATGTLMINVPINNAHYIIRNEETAKLVADHKGGSQTFELSAGFYRVEFEEVFGYDISDMVHTFELAPDSTIVIEGSYEPTTCGKVPILGLRIFPETASYIIYDDQQKEIAEGTGSQFFTFPEGDYSVEFAEMQDFLKPQKLHFPLFDAKVTTLNVIYTKSK